MIVFKQSSTCIDASNPRGSVMATHQIKGASGDDDLSDDVRWLYIGCRCPKCGQVGCYADWKNEFNDFEKFLSNA